jgi:hypothetical protein
MQEGSEGDSVGRQTRSILTKNMKEAWLHVEAAEAKEERRRGKREQ